MFGSFKEMVSEVYREWSWYLKGSLNPEDQEFFDSICRQTASVEKWKTSLKRLSTFLAEKAHQKVMVFVDEYETPNNCAYEHGFFKEVRSLYIFLFLS